MALAVLWGTFASMVAAVLATKYVGNNAAQLALPVPLATNVAQMPTYAVQALPLAAVSQASSATP